MCELVHGPLLQDTAGEWRRAGGCMRKARRIAGRGGKGWGGRMATAKMTFQALPVTCMVQRGMAERHHPRFCASTFGDGTVSGGASGDGEGKVCIGRETVHQESSVV